MNENAEAEFFNTPPEDMDAICANCGRTFGDHSAISANCPVGPERFKPIASEPTKQPKPHNPDGLTDEQVGVADGWRLLDTDELVTARSPALKEIECWNSGTWDNFEWIGYAKQYTYRTKLTRAELRKARGLPEQPKPEPEAHVPRCTVCGFLISTIYKSGIRVPNCGCETLPESEVNPCTPRNAPAEQSPSKSEEDSTKDSKPSQTAAQSTAGSEAAPTSNPEARLKFGHVPGDFFGVPVKLVEQLEDEARSGHLYAAIRPKVVCLCGSSKFPEAHMRAMMEETLAGNIVIPMGLYGHADFPSGARAATNDGDESTEVKQMLDRLHFAKIDIADEILVVAVGGYIGSSTRREIEYAQSKGKSVQIIHPEPTGESALAATLAEIASLLQRVYMPGTWHCDKCGFEQNNRTLHVQSGTISAPRIEEVEVCPNDGDTMRKVTWEECSQSNYEAVGRFLDERDAALAENERLKLERDGLASDACQNHEHLRQEISRLVDQIDLNRDEFKRIWATTTNSEIRGLCERAQQQITQRVSVIQQRDKAEMEVGRLSTENQKLREALSELRDAMIRYEADVDSGPTESHVQMMRRVSSALGDQATTTDPFDYSKPYVPASELR